jgi:hypothetical protein
VVLLAVAPLVLAIAFTLWRTPFPLSEGVALLEDVVNRPATSFLTPSLSYYRPVFHVTLSAIWNSDLPVTVRLGAIKLISIGAVTALGVLFVWCIRPRTWLDAVLGIVAAAVLFGHPGFRDNLEIPLTYTLVGMPIALGVWLLLQRPASTWRAALILPLVAVAVGFKEQGLVLGPVILAAFVTGVRGADRRLAAATVVLCALYVAIRLIWRGEWAMFEQAVGFGFDEMNPDEAAERFGEVPYLMYPYSSASAILNVLFSEPTRGMFTVVEAVAEGSPPLNELVHVGSSAALTLVIGWWGVRAWRSRTEAGAPDVQLSAVLVAALLASGVLSFNYSRDRLGGMATVFYALAAFHALRAACSALLARPRWQFACGAALAVLLAVAWQLRAVGTLERARLTASNNQLEWTVAAPARRVEFAERPTYLDLMTVLAAQGADRSVPHPTMWPRPLAQAMGTPTQ